MSSATHPHTTTSAVVKSPDRAIPDNTWFTADELINAFQKGQESFTRQMIAKIQKNTKLAKKLSEQIIQSMSDKCKVKCKSIHLRTDSVNVFSAMFVIPEKNFLDFDTYSKLSDTVLETIHSFNKNVDIFFDFSFLPSSRSVNKQAIVADGYNLSYRNA